MLIKCMFVKSYEQNVHNLWITLPLCNILLTVIHKVINNENSGRRRLFLSYSLISFLFVFLPHQKHFCAQNLEIKLNEKNKRFSLLQLIFLTLNDFDESST